MGLTPQYSYKIKGDAQNQWKRCSFGNRGRCNKPVVNKGKRRQQREEMISHSFKMTPHVIPEWTRCGRPSWAWSRSSLAPCWSADGWWSSGSTCGEASTSGRREHWGPGRQSRWPIPARACYRATAMPIPSWSCAGSRPHCSVGGHCWPVAPMAAVEHRGAKS